MVRKLAVGPLQANCYILGCDESKRGLVIDPGADVRMIVREISRLRLNVLYILLTHGHFDHTGGTRELKKITGAPVMIHHLDSGGLDFEADEHLAEGRELRIGRHRISVLHTPGHTPGGLSFHTAGAVFTGDTLLAGSIGRTDMPGGSRSQLVRAVARKILPLGDDTRVYPGHGPRTTVGRERMTNPFLRM